MAWICKDMSNITENSFYVINLEHPDVKILQYNYFHRIPSWNHRNLSSPFWYLWHNDQNGAFVQSGEKEIELKPDMTLLLPPNTIFSTRSNGMPFNQFYIHFTAGNSFRQIRREPVTVSTESLFGPSSSLFFSEIESCHQNRTLLSMKLYDIVFRSLFLISPECFLSPEENAIDERIERALHLMNLELAISPSNEEICDVIKMSENNFIRVFKKEMGVSPQQYLLMRRIEKCRNLLLNSSLSIEEIADSAGFADRYHFSKAFKQMTRFSPAAYRKTMQTGISSPRTP